jgi:hypothetical protein
MKHFFLGALVLFQAFTAASAIPTARMPLVGQHSAEASQKNTKAHARRLAKNQVSTVGPQPSWLLDSADTHYTAYQQAWRYLGFYIDCNVQEDHKRRRKLEDVEADDDQWQQGSDGEEESGCQRYLLWAAYIDLDYQGGGIGEYQFFDTTTNQWDTSACEATGLERCAKMDCHLPETKFQLLGFYKQEEFSEWFEQLFKHQGYCIWNDQDIFELMYGNYDSWPDECTETEVYLADGTTALYYDLKPVADGNMTIGLYTDARCTSEYTIDTVLGNENGNKDDGMMLGDYANMWNEAMSIYKVCQPCRAYNLQGENQEHRRRLEEEPSGLFQCNDKAGYTGASCVYIYACVFVQLSISNCTFPHRRCSFSKQM